MHIHNNVFYDIYADDTVVVSTNKAIEKAVEGSMSMFEQIQEWCMLNNIRVNIHKTKHMIIGGNNQRMSIK